MVIETTFKCPSCNKPLKATAGTPWLVWCSYGPCHSIAANEGAYGTTVEEAVAVLVERVDAEYEKEKLNAN